jgi:hypothetical protein
MMKDYYGAVLVVLFVLVFPVIFLWALNTLLSLNLAYTLKNYGASAVFAYLALLNLTRTSND